MRTVICGEIEDFVPFFNACLDERRCLMLSEHGDFSMTVDTGFSGGIALPFDIIDEMGLEWE